MWSGPDSAPSRAALWQTFRARARPVVAGAVAMVFAILPGYTTAEGGFARDPLVLWRGQEAVAQREALSWVRENLPANAAIVIDRYLWTDLQGPAGADDPTFVLAHDYRKIDADPYIRRNVFEEDWRNFDYLVFSGQLVHDVQADDLTFLASILEHSTPVATFDTGGWPIYVHRVFHEDVIPVADHELLQGAWTDYLDRFVTHDGRVIADDLPDRGTTSEGQAYAMLRAVYAGDRDAFDLVWGWAAANLQRDDGLLSWRWDGDPGRSSTIRRHRTLRSMRRSHCSSHRGHGASQGTKPRLRSCSTGSGTSSSSRSTAQGSWSRATGRSVMPSPSSTRSYFAPYAFRIFADAQPHRDWLGLVDSSYDILEAWAADDELGAPVGALPNWLAIDTRSGVLELATGRARSADEFSYDSSRAMFRLALDWLWFGEERALASMKAIGLPLRELREKGYLAAAYRLDGAPAVTYEASSMYAGTLAAVLADGDRDLAVRIHSQRILGPALDDGSADWSSYYAQNWAWFATALLDGGMANLWAGETTAPWRVQP